MDSDQELLDAQNAREDAREEASWKRKRADTLRYENAAKQAHLIRESRRLLNVNADVCDWDDLAIISQRHLIADAEIVAANPSINLIELTRLYNERLIAWGDTESPDLGFGDENAPIYQVIEEMVLKRLKEVLNDPLSIDPPS